MLTAIVALIALAAPPASAAKTDEAKLAQLSAARGAFEKQYRSPKEERLQVTENLGTTGLGNPYRDWYFPAGSAAYRIWVVTYQGYETSDSRGRRVVIPSSGALVYQSRHGSYTTTDWVLKLAAGKSKNPTGTVEKLIADAGLKVNENPTAFQVKLLKAKQAYVGLSEGRGMFCAEIFTWFVSANGKSAKDNYLCDPSVPKRRGGSSAGINDVLFAPPILPEEAQYLGIKRTTTWHGKGKYSIVKNAREG